VVIRLVPLPPAHNLVFNSHHTSFDSAGFLATPSPLHKCIQEIGKGKGEERAGLKPGTDISAMGQEGVA
jgi:hypothetical protein